MTALIRLLGSREHKRNSMKELSRMMLFLRATTRNSKISKTVSMLTNSR
jgi:hypothetical protein